MRASIFALALLAVAPAVAHAEPFVELGGGLDIPISDSDYTDAVDPSVDLAARIGAGGPKLGGMASVDWTPLSSNINSVTFQRFRILGHIFGRHVIAPKVELQGRFGAGIDVLHESLDFTVPIVGTHVTGSDTDVGFALEAAVGVWFGVGSGATQIGAELAMPISIHSKNGTPNDPNDPKIDYTGVDLDIVGGVRLRL